MAQANCKIRWMRGAALAALILSAACAKQAPPPGGPPDHTPPRVVWTVPAADSVWVGLDAAIRIGFSEPMDRRSVERAVFISPQPSGEPAFRWRRREVEIRLGEGLRPDRTYVITLGSEAADLSQNRMAASHSFAFATGASLNRGEVLGRVLPLAEGAPGQTYVWAYDLREGRDPDPAADRPAYVTQPDVGGGYRLPRLGPGRYRLFAFHDRNGDRAYTPQAEPIAVPPADVLLTPGAERARLGALRMAVRDTVPPRLLSARTPDRTHFLLRFDEPVRPAGGVCVEGPDGHLALLALTCDPGDSSQVGLLTAPQEGDAPYRILLGGIADRAGNRISPEEEARVRGDASPDRRPPAAASISPRSGARYVSPQSPLWVDFDEAMSPVFPADFWVLSDSTAAPEGEFSWPAPNRLQFAPGRPWAPGETIRLLGRVGGLSDASGNALEGPPLSFAFTLLAPDDVGSLSGPLAPATGPVVVEALRVSPPQGQRRVAVSPGDTLYTLDGLTPGRYRVTGFLDADGDGGWTQGRPLPFAPSEPVAELPDTLEVRARWGTVSEHRLRMDAWYAHPDSMREE